MNIKKGNTYKVRLKDRYGTYGYPGWWADPLIGTLFDIKIKDINESVITVLYKNELPWNWAKNDFIWINNKPKRNILWL